VPVPAVVLVVLGGDAGGGLLAEPNVDTGGQVPVAGLGLTLRRFVRWCDGSGPMW
jgi:hypothetical protein